MSDLQNAVEQLRAQARAFRAVIRVADAIEGITSLDRQTWTCFAGRERTSSSKWLTPRRRPCALSTTPRR